MNCMQSGVKEVQKMWLGLTFRAVATLYLAVDGVLLLRAVVSNPDAEGLGQQAFWVFIDALLLYRVSRGSRRAWRILLLLTALPIALIPFMFAKLSPLLILVLCLLQLALVLHPAMRRRVGFGRQAAPTNAGGSA